jgi:hypothetical protein
MTANTNCFFYRGNPAGFSDQRVRQSVLQAKQGTAFIRHRLHSLTRPADVSNHWEVGQNRRQVERRDGFQGGPKSELLRFVNGLQRAKGNGVGKVPCGFGSKVRENMRMV